MEDIWLIRWFDGDGDAHTKILNDEESAEDYYERLEGSEDIGIIQFFRLQKHTYGDDEP